MRSLLLLAAAAAYACVAFRMPEAKAAFTGGEARGATTVLRMVERAAVLGRTEECAVLSPLPLYAGAPSVRDWTSFCEAEVLRDSGRCSAIGAMLTPDLRTFCERSFVSLPS